MSFYMRAVNCSYEVGELSITQKRGIISLIPKGDKPREYLKNWRPISLLNTSYKIISSFGLKAQVCFGQTNS